MDILQRIKELSEKRGISLSFLCAKMGVAKVYFNDIAKKNRKIEDERLQIIADTLFTTVDYLKGETDEDNIPTVNKISDDEAEMLRIYRSLDISGKRQLMGKAYELLDKKENAFGDETESEKEDTHSAVPVSSISRDS